MGGKRILIVDDDHLIAASFQDIIEREGFEVDTTTYGKDAILRVRENLYDLVILDIMLPDINGDEVAKEIRKFNDSVSLVFITGYPSMQRCIDTLDLKVSEILLKPVTPEELLLTVKDEVSIHAVKPAPSIRDSSVQSGYE